MNESIHNNAFVILGHLVLKNGHLYTTYCPNFGMDFVDVRSRLAPISSNVSSVKTVRLRFFFFCHRTSGFEFLRIVNLEGGTSPGNV